MSLPQLYHDAETYLDDLVPFLQKYQWIFNYPNTHILINNVLDNFPPEWIAYFNSLTIDEINLLSIGVAKNPPQEFAIFLNDLNKLKPAHREEAMTAEHPMKFQRVSAKKSHEISRFAPFIAKMCNEQHLEDIIDIGSGLGYLTHLLHDKYQKHVLGIEGCEDKHRQALEYQQKLYPNSNRPVQHIQHYVTSESARFFAGEVNQLDDGKRWCMVGLHACADLSVDILDIFLNLDNIRMLIIMPCCYHRLKMLPIEQSCTEDFHGFPKSILLKALFDKYEANYYIRRPFLRNACQQTNAAILDMSENDHKMHAINVLLRSIVQLVAKEYDLTLNRKKRKSGKLLKMEEFDEFQMIDNYLNNLSSLFMFKKSDGVTLDANVIVENVKEKWAIHREKLHLIEVLTSLQSALQSISENLLLFDRKLLLNEKNVNCNVLKITDDHISPRCLALVAIK